MNWLGRLIPSKSHKFDKYLTGRFGISTIECFALMKIYWEVLDVVTGVLGSRKGCIMEGIKSINYKELDFSLFIYSIKLAAMLRSFILLFLATLLITSNSQCTAFQSTLNYMVTGLAELGAPTDPSAKEDYSIVFSSNDVLGTWANIFHAFCNSFI